MKIISWNILADEFIDSDYFMIPSELLNSVVRYEKIKNKIIDADVILLQEVMGSFTEFTEHHIIRGKDMIWQGVKSSSCAMILLRKSLFSISSILYLDFGVGVYCTYKDTSLLIINIHLDDLSHDVRMRQINSLVFNSIPVILGGDFNEEGLYPEGFTVWNNKPTYFMGETLCIDNILTRGFESTRGFELTKEFNSCHVDNVNDVVSQFELYGSDHLPVILEKN